VGEEDGRGEWEVEGGVGEGESGEEAVGGENGGVVANGRISRSPVSIPTQNG